MCKKESYVVSAIIVLAVTVVIFFPVLGFAGSLEPSAAPAPTMKTLDQIPPTWSQTLPAAQRFELVLDGAGVLDKETGLVWEQSPLVTVMTWTTAIYNCAIREVGGRKGWHLPTIEQLASLVDPTVAYPGIPLPSGHPFTSVHSGIHWSATTSAGRAASAWYVDFRDGYVATIDKAADVFMWCVRGGQGYDAY